MRVVIVRHGQSVANAEGRWQGQLDYELSAEGIRQAELLRGRFTEEKFDPQCVYASPLIRAMGTAEIAMPAKRIITIDDLKEGGAGVFEGRTMDEIRRNIRRLPWSLKERVVLILYLTQSHDLIFENVHRLSLISLSGAITKMTK